MDSTNLETYSNKHTGHNQTLVGGETIILPKEELRDMHWQTYINHHHLQNKNINLPKEEWAATLIILLWEHLRRVSDFCNGVYHAENSGRIA
jgi:hypothetical protein